MHSIHIRNASRLILAFLPCSARKIQISGDIQREAIPLLCANPANDSISTLDGDGMAATASTPNSSASSLPCFPPCLAASCPPPPVSCQILLSSNRPVHAAFLVFVQLGFIHCIPAPRPSFFIRSFLWTSPAASFLPPTAPDALCWTLPSRDPFV